MIRNSSRMSDSGAKQSKDDRWRCCQMVPKVPFNSAFITAALVLQAFKEPALNLWLTIFLVYLHIADLKHFASYYRLAVLVFCPSGATNLQLHVDKITSTLGCSFADL